MKPRTRLQSDYQLSRVQDFSAQSEKDLLRKNPILDSSIVQTLISTSNTEVLHGLGRPFNGWVVIDKDANYDVWQSGIANADPSKRIYLVSDGLVTVKILFF